MTEFVIPAPELARLTHNALAFMPARSAVKVCRVMASGQALSLMATDLFTVGEDMAVVRHVFYEAISIDLSREDLRALDKAARAAKKEDVKVIIRHQDGMEFRSESESLTALDCSAWRDPKDLWELTDELLTRLEGADDDTVPGYLTIDPKMLSAFGKVKPSDGKECIADLCFRGSEGQILVKIGATFKGAIMPVDRGEAAESDDVGPEGLWSDEKVNN